ncbi:hypothetical protein BSKO_10118 [Bryopsis sp. KO-2023]|nr:hypothetical protein BSKO_10118 [Bryopsis sp. KO-2023]
MASTGPKSLDQMVDGLTEAREAADKLMSEAAQEIQFSKGRIKELEEEAQREKQARAALWTSLFYSQRRAKELEQLVEGEKKAQVEQDKVWAEKLKTVKGEAADLARQLGDAKRQIAQIQANHQDWLARSQRRFTKWEQEHKAWMEGQTNTLGGYAELQQILGKRGFEPSGTSVVIKTEKRARPNGAETHTVNPSGFFDSEDEKSWEVVKVGKFPII